MGLPSYQGCWKKACALCELTDTYVQDSATTPAMVASTIVHEAMHARLDRWGFGYEEDKRQRIERICFQASIAFARRLPLSEQEARKYIMSTARRQIERDPRDWTDLGRLEGDMEMFRKQGCPNWMVALLRRWALAKIQRSHQAG